MFRQDLFAWSGLLAMIDAFSSVSKAIVIAKKLKETSEKIKDADLKISLRTCILNWRTRKRS
jgi:hypothetical protein